MFKRQFYALEHSNRDDSASSSSLDTDSDSEGGLDLEDDGAWPVTPTLFSSCDGTSITMCAVTTTSGLPCCGAESSHESDSSEEEDVDPSERGEPPPSFNGPRSDSVELSGNETEDLAPKRNACQSTGLSKQWAEAVEEDERERILDKFEEDSVISLGSTKQVLKCRLCPKIICLSEESMTAHLKSKGHGRSLKQLALGKLKVQLDSDGEEEEEGETHAERHARVMNASFEEKEASVKRKRGGGRQRQCKRQKRKTFIAKEQRKSLDFPLHPSPGGRELHSVLISKESIAGGKSGITGMELQKKSSKVTRCEGKVIQLQRKHKKQRAVDQPSKRE